MTYLKIPFTEDIYFDLSAGLITIFYYTIISLFVILSMGFVLKISIAETFSIMWRMSLVLGLMGFIFAGIILGLDHNDYNYLNNKQGGTTK